MSAFPHVATLLAGSLLAGLWQGAVLVGCVALLLRMMPRVTPGMRSAVWLGVFGLLMLLPVLAVARQLGSQAAFQSGGGAAPVQANPAWAVALVAIWAALVCLRAVQLGRSALVLRGIWRRAIPFAGFVAGTGGAGDVPVCTSDEVAVPSVIGFLAPRIVLPSGLAERLSADDLDAILRHEREHLRRRDDWTNLLQKVGVVLFPVHPVLLWVERQLCRERELACDDGVLRSTGAPRSYAATLANLAEFTLVRRGLSLALGAWGRRPELLVRVERILYRPAKPLGRRATTAVLAGVLAASAAGTVELARSPQLISFGSHAQAVLTGNSSARAGLRSASSYRTENVVFHQGRPSAPLAFRAIAARAVVAPRVQTFHRERVQSRGVRWQAEGRETLEHRFRTAPIPSVVVLTSWEWTEPATVAVRARETQAAVHQLVFSRDPRTSAAAGSAVEPYSRSDSAFTYAAVPVQGGWLIVQL